MKDQTVHTDRKPLVPRLIQLTPGRQREDVPAELSLLSEGLVSSGEVNISLGSIMQVRVIINDYLLV